MVCLTWPQYGLQVLLGRISLLSTSPDGIDTIAKRRINLVSRWCESNHLWLSRSFGSSAQHQIEKYLLDRLLSLSVIRLYLWNYLPIPVALLY